MLTTETQLHGYRKENKLENFALKHANNWNTTARISKGKLVQGKEGRKYVY